MNKKYTKKQICETIKYWQKRLNESVDSLQDYIDDEIMSSAGKSQIAGEAFFKLIPKFKEFNNKNEELFTKNGFPWQRITDEQSAISIIDMIHDSKFDFPLFKFLPSDIQRLLKTIRTAWDFDQSSPMWSRFHRQNDDGIHMHDPEVYESIQTNKARLKKKNDMKKTYTKKQITEAIAYWEKQLQLGNYRKVYESKLADDEVQDQVERVMEKASDYFGSSDRDRFDKWREDTEKWIEDEIRYGDSSFDELVKGAIAVITDND